MKRILILTSLILAAIFTARGLAQEPNAWVKYEGNPVLGGDLGVCFDVSLTRENDVFKMWFSWRTKGSIGYTESVDGIHWKEPIVVLPPRDSGWEKIVNRCSVVRRGELYYMWYTGQTDKTSQIGFAISRDGVHWDRPSDQPVLKSEEEWEKTSAMCPDVQWDEEEQLFKMRYSAGEQYEPNAIGYATSPDGTHWTKYASNPIFVPDKSNAWEQHKVTACQVLKRDEWYYMFYIGFENEHLARIGIARSRDGISEWERCKSNPIVSPDKDKWDADACYKPFVIYDEKEELWRLWYNGRRGNVEQIGLVTRKGEKLDF